MLASSSGLFKVGKASLFNRRRNVSLHSMLSRNCGECPGSYASSLKCREQVFYRYLQYGTNKSLEIYENLCICTLTDARHGVKFSVRLSVLMHALTRNNVKRILEKSNTYVLHNYIIPFALHLVRVDKMFFKT